MSVEHATLIRERDALRRYVDQAAGPLVPFDAVVVVIRGGLLQEVLDGVLPVERSVGESVLLTLRSARVRFRSGLALVELEGRAALRDNPDVFADLLVSGVLEVLGVDSATGTLTTRIQVLGFETADVGVAGLSPPAERLVNRLASGRAQSLNEVLERIEVPIRLAETLDLPAVEEPEVTIRGGSVAFRLQVEDVKVLDDRLWVAVAAHVRAAGGEAAPSGDSTAASGDSTAIPGDSTATSGDSTATSGDSTSASGDSTAASGESIAASGDSMATPADSTLPPAHSTAPTGNAAVSPLSPTPTRGASAAAVPDSPLTPGRSPAETDAARGSP